MTRIPPIDYTKQPTKEELQQMADNYSKTIYGEGKLLEKHDELTRLSRESKLANIRAA
jgi:hypothetical protein